MNSQHFCWNVGHFYRKINRPFSSGHHVMIFYWSSCEYIYTYNIYNIFGWYWLSFGVPLYVSTLIAFLQFQLLLFCTFFASSLVRFFCMPELFKVKKLFKTGCWLQIKKMLYFFNFLHSEIMADQSRTRTPPVNLVEKTKLVQQKRYIFI